MEEGRRSFIFKAVVGITGFTAGCVGSDQSGGEPTTQMTDSDSQPASETVAQISTSRSEPSPTVPDTADSTQSSSDCRMTATQKGTAIIEAAPPDITIENVTDERQTVRITATRLPEDMTARPPEKAPHEPRDLSTQPVFSQTTEMPAGEGRVYRCTGMEDEIPRKEFQLKIEVRGGPTGVFDWSQNTAMLYVDIKASSIEFSVRQGK
jgi:cytoskeletal protein RodZ